MKASPTEHSADHALFVDDKELHRRINPELTWDRFRAALRESEGRRSPSGLVFPKVKALWGGRYWPGVVAWLDDDEGVTDHGLASNGDDDKPESFNASPRKKTRSQVHTADGAALLVREAGSDKHHGLSGSVHRLAGRSR